MRPKVCHNLSPYAETRKKQDISHINTSLTINLIVFFWCDMRTGAFECLQALFARTSASLSIPNGNQWNYTILSSVWRNNQDFSYLKCHNLSLISIHTLYRPFRKQYHSLFSLFLFERNMEKKRNYKWNHHTDKWVLGNSNEQTTIMFEHIHFWPSIQLKYWLRDCFYSAVFFSLSFFRSLSYSLFLVLPFSIYLRRSVSLFSSLFLRFFLSLSCALSSISYSAVKQHSIDYRKYSYDKIISSELSKNVD